jgi:hypothetical protein
MITNEPLDWSSDDELNLRAFLATPTGKRFLPKLCEASPVNLPKGEIPEVLIRSGEVRGFSDAVRTILSLTVRPQIDSVELNQTTNYPALENDAAWTDGQKSNA